MLVKVYMLIFNKFINLAWLKFLKGKFDYKFLVNPKPRYLSDIILDQDKTKMFIEGPIMKSEDLFEIAPTFLYSKKANVINLQVDCLLNPILYSYNNPEKKINTVVNDIPILIHRDYVARQASLKDLRDLFDNYVESLEDDSDNFDPALLRPELFIEPKIDYITEVLRQSCLISQKILAIMDFNHVEFVADKWLTLDKKIKNLSDCIIKPGKGTGDLTYLEYVEKQVILDLIFDPFVQQNFIKFESFPFSANDTIGAAANKTNIFIIWDHYYRKYAKLINNRLSIAKEFVLKDPKADFLKGEDEFGGMDDNKLFDIEDMPGKKEIKYAEPLKTKKKGKIHF